MKLKLRNKNGKYRDEQNTVIFRFISAILDELDLNWVQDEDNDLALTILIFDPDYKPDIAQIPDSIFFPQEEVSSGREVYYFGFPENQVDENLNPIVRKGLIAAKRDPQYGDILIDAMVFGGNSGGACFLKMAEFGINEEFLGIITKTYTRTATTDRSQYIFSAGLSFVIPSNKILNLLHSEEYKNHKKTFLKR